MNKLVITRYKNKILEAYFENSKLSDLMLLDAQSCLNNIYVGKVVNIVKNIDACFVDVGLSVPCYYSLSENKHIFVNSKKDDIVRVGDELLVQIKKEAIKTKNPEAVSELSLKGEYVVINNSGVIGVSSKIKDKDERKRFHEIANEFLPEGIGCVIRTVCEYADKELLVSEIKELSGKLKNIMEASRTRTCFSCLYKNNSEYLDYFILKYNAGISEVVTDDAEIFDEFKAHFKEKDITSPELRLYQDKTCSLMAAYNLNKELESATKEKVWLKSGAYLVIEQTEAMVVIDVNTGKSTANKNIDEHMLAINIEAAIEACRQLRIRNLSGMILIDFINMKKPSSMDAVKEVLERELARDSVAAKFVDVTKLGLVEITRKKIRRSLKEQL